MIAFGGRQGPHRSGSRCRGRPIERREAGREGCLWPNAASQGRPPDGSGGETERALHGSRNGPPAKTLWWCVVVVVVAATPNYLRQASQNLGKYSLTYLGGPTSTSADVSVPRPRTHDDRTAGSSPDHLITHTLTQLLTYFTCTTAAGRRVAACARHPCSTLRQF